MSVSEGIKRFHNLKGLYQNPPQCTCGVNAIQDVNIDDLGDDLAECLCIQDDLVMASNSILLSQSDQNDISKATKEDICEEACETELANVVCDNCLDKCATLPCSCEVRCFGATLKREDEEVEDEMSSTLLKEKDYESAKLDDPPVPFSTPVKLVSAMKGSREKLGAPRKRLTVTWAPDVYDPPPMAPVYVVTSKGQRSRSDRKKSGKNRQKSVSKSKRGKDKKQIPKCRSSNRGLKFSTADFRMVEYDATGAYMELEDVNVDSQDVHCASSFLKKSITRVQFSVAEAT